MELMAFDEELAGRIRSVLTGKADFTEKKMFGGLAFLIGGNMAVSASSHGGMLLRADPAASDELCSNPGVERAVMQGRAMDGWLRVSDDVIASEEELARWVQVGVDYASSLPPK
jgi:TfoX/Sxy family transcriptional regulator of competence genes